MSFRTTVLLSAIVLAAVTRWVPHLANFAPITAMAVFATARLTDRRLALLVPLVALFVSDLGLEALHRLGLSKTWGLYPTMWVVYAATLAVALLGFMIRRSRSPFAIAGTVLSGSLLFFLLSNLGVWAFWGIYPRTLDGLLLCYTQAIPFYRFSMLGDCVYGLIFFGGFALAEARFPALRPAEQQAA
jgi:hypothetical protein